MTVREAIEAAAHQAAAGHPHATERRNALLAYAAARGVRIRTLTTLTNTPNPSVVHRWTGGANLPREAILNDPAPTDLTAGLEPTVPHPGQTHLIA
jgi:hypothetical protein